MSEWNQHPTLMEAEYGPVPSANREAWLESRTSSIGASESGAACGRSKWEQPYDIWARKTGRRGEVEETAAMRLGTYLEPYVIGEYARQTGLSMLYVDTDMPILRSKKHNWLTATPDALVSTPGVSPYLVEAKIVRGFPGDDWGTPLDVENGPAVMPEHYYYQCQHQMLVSGTQRCDLVVLFVVSGEVVVYRIDRNFDAIFEIGEKTQKLWQLIVIDKPPEFILGHPTTPGAMAEEYKATEHDADLFETDDQKMEDMADYFTKANKEYKQMGDHLTILKQRLLEWMETHDKVKTRSGYILSRTCSKETLITEKDVENLREKIGQPKRKSSITFIIKEPKQ